MADDPEDLTPAPLEPEDQGDSPEVEPAPPPLDPEAGSLPAEEVIISVPVVYANAIGVNAGPYDVMLDFALRQPETHSGEISPDELQVRVVMSWPHLKSMIPLLTRMVAHYEMNVGPITSPGFEESSRS